MSKSTLEKAAKLSTGLSRELSNIQSFVDNIRVELSQKESQKVVKDIAAELEWLEVMPLFHLIFDF